MLFRLADDTPRFQVFELLNDEFLFFLGRSVNETEFNRGFFTSGEIGEACWGNAKTKEKFKSLFDAISSCGFGDREKLFKAVSENQDLQAFFNNPNPDFLGFVSPSCFEALCSVLSHLYCATKDLAKIVAASGGENINDHFNNFRRDDVNGNICKACGMEGLSVFREGVGDGDQWRSDYDHQLCKSKYPVFAVHPDNLIPLCDVCNQDAKKAKDLFKNEGGQKRLAFYPYSEEAKDFIDFEINNLCDPEPSIRVKWISVNPDILAKLETWDYIYEIRSRVEGRFRSLEAVIEDEINPETLGDIENEVRRFARPRSTGTLKRKEWAFWHQKLFSVLAGSDLSPFIAKLEFVRSQGEDGGKFILE